MHDCHVRSVADYRVVVSTNQSGIARGLFDMATLNAIHQKMHNAAQAVGASIDTIFFCPHAATDNCDCRKPKLGMVRQAAQDLNLALNECWLIGDTTTDVETAHRAGLKSIAVRTGSAGACRPLAGEPVTASSPACRPVPE